MQPWDTLAGVGASLYPFLPVRLMVGDKYNSLANLANFTGPVAFVVCEKDRTIPPALSRRVYDAYAGKKSWLEHPDCDHNTWPGDPDLMWWRTVTDFIAPPPAANPAK
jgi:pimeloyl-ACP methyl ester carboxylesterase